MKKRNKKNLKLVLYFGSFWIIATLIFIVFRNNSAIEPQDLGTCKTPEQAYIETQKALELLSVNINSGMESVEYIKEYETTKNKIFKNKVK